MSDLLLSLVTVKILLVSYDYLIVIIGGGIIYYSYRNAMNSLFVLGTLILGVGLGSWLFRLIRMTIVYKPYGL